MKKIIYFILIISLLFCVSCKDKRNKTLPPKEIFLTFDDGPCNNTLKILEVLEKYDIRATFFVVGTWAEKYSASVKKLSESGHEIANHSDTHPHINNLSEQKIAEEIKACDDKIERITGKRPTLFRGPYGEYNNTVIETAEKAGHNVIQWDVDLPATLGKPLYERGWRWWKRLK